MDEDVSAMSDPDFLALRRASLAWTQAANR